MAAPSDPSAPLPRSSDGGSVAPWSAVAVLALLLVVLVGAAAVADSGDRPSFATPTEEVDGPPGRLLAAEEVDTPTGVDATVWRVEYATEAPDGAIVPATGLVIRPTGDPPAGGFPVVAWAHPTTGVADPCAPSMSSEPVGPWIDGLLDRRAVVVAPDYAGLGSPGPHPYLVGEAEGAAVLDGVRAARQLDGAGAATDGPVVLAGYSQGGHAVLFARAMAADHAPELDVVGAVAVAPVTDMASFVAGGRSNPDLLAIRLYVLRTWSQVYEGLSWADVTSAEGEALAPQIDDSCVGSGDLAGDGPVERFWGVPPESLPEWRAAFAENTPRATGSQIPLVVAHGGADGIVPFAGSERFAAAACRFGEPVELWADPDGNHATAMTDNLVPLATWIDDRLDGVPTAAAC